MPLVKVQEKGQVTLPTKLRRELGLDPGDYVAIERKGSRIVLVHLAGIGDSVGIGEPSRICHSPSEI
jgi:AbrB family looped-hinge helix DNA binding protein